MKYLVIAAVAAVSLASVPAYAGNSSNGIGLGIGAGLTTGKGGLLGTLLGSNGYGRSNTTAIAVGANLTTGKGGLLGTLLGSGSSSHGGGHGGWR